MIEATGSSRTAFGDGRRPTASEANRVGMLAGNDPIAVVFDLVSPLRA
jgi:hypothetical protein